MDEKIEKFSSSDYHTTTMHASNTFDRLLQEIRSSNLNFQLQESPFSAQISIKKSLVKEKNGSFRHPPVISCKDAKIKALETRANYLEKELESILHIPDYRMILPQSWKYHHQARIIAYVKEDIFCEEIETTYFHI